MERLALDLNGDSKVDVADLVYHLVFNSQLAPSVAFESFTQRVFETDTTVRVPLVFSKKLAAPTTIAYTVSGTATAGTDYTIAGYDGGTGQGRVDVEAGASGATIEVLVHDDAEFGEGVETIQLTLTGGDESSYFLGALQTHWIYLEDNDAVWSAGLELADSGYAAFSIALTQYGGTFTGRVISDSGLIPTPAPDDANRSGDDGWEARIAASGTALRIEIGPVPLPASQSFFAVHYNRYLTLEVKPGLSNYAFDPNRFFSGEASQVLEPVRSRLGAAWTERSFLRRETHGTFGMIREAGGIVSEETVLVQAP